MFLSYLFSLFFFFSHSIFSFFVSSFRVIPTAISKILRLIEGHEDLALEFNQLLNLPAKWLIGAPDKDGTPTIVSLSPGDYFSSYPFPFALCSSLSSFASSLPQTTEKKEEVKKAMKKEAVKKEEVKKEAVKKEVVKKEVVKKEAVKKEEKKKEAKEFYCRVCNVSAPNPFNFQQHLNGKKHLTAVRLKEKEEIREEFIGGGIVIEPKEKEKIKEEEIREEFIGGGIVIEPKENEKIKEEGKGGKGRAKEKEKEGGKGKEKERENRKEDLRNFMKNLRKTLAERDPDAYKKFMEIPKYYGDSSNEFCFYYYSFNFSFFSFLSFNWIFTAFSSFSHSLLIDPILLLCVKL